MRQVAYGFIFAAMAGVLLDWPFEAIFFLLFAAMTLALLAPLAPTRAHRAARRRNHARRIN